MNESQKDDSLYQILCRLFAKVNPQRLDAGDKQRNIQLRKRTLQTAFKTLLESHEEPLSNEGTLLQYYRLVYGLRVSLRYDKANDIENCLDIVQRQLISDVAPVLQLLLKLQNISGTLETNELATIKPKTIPRSGVSKFPEQTLLYGTTNVTLMFFPFSYPHFSRDAFQADHHPVVEIPGWRMKANKLSSLPDLTGIDTKHRNLFGALRVIPKTLNYFGISSTSQFSLGIPELSLQEPQIFTVPTHSPSGSDEGYGSSVTSPVPIHQEHGKKTPIKKQQSHSAVWDDIESLLADSTVRKTWDSSSVSCFLYVQPEKPYLTEAPLPAMGAVCRMIKDNLNLMTPDRMTEATRHITEPVFVRNLIYLIQGVETELFQFLGTTQQFVLKDKLAIPGLSEDVLTDSITSVLEMGSVTRRLHQLTSVNVPSFTGRAFCGQVGKYLQFQQLVLIDYLEKEKKFSLEFVRKVQRLVPLARKLLSDARRCSDRKGEEGWAVLFLEELVDQINVSCWQEERSLLMAIFCATIRPFLKFLEKWIFEGVCCDPYHEFVIQVSPEFLDARERSYWTEGFALRPAVLTAGRSFTRGLTSMLADVLLCGKTVNLIKLCQSKCNFGNAIPLRLYLDLETLGKAAQLCRKYEDEHVFQEDRPVENAEELARTAGRIREANLLDLEESNRAKKQAAALHKEQQQRLLREQLDQQVEEKRKEREKQAEKERKEEEERQKIYNETLRKEMEAKRKLMDRYAQLLSNEPIQTTEDVINANDESLDEEGNILQDVARETPRNQTLNPVISAGTVTTDVPDSISIANGRKSSEIPHEVQPVEPTPPRENTPSPTGEQQIENPANQIKLELKTKIVQNFEVSDWLQEVKINQMEISTFSLSYFVEQSLELPLRAQTRVANSALLNYFLKDQKLVHHLEFLRDFLFLNDGSFSRSLVSDIGSRLSKASRVWQIVNIPTLNSVLNESLYDSLRKDDLLKGDLSFFINDVVPDEVDLDSVGVSSCFSLRFRVHWPQNLILTEALMDDYSSIFTLILQLKLASWTLRQVLRHEKLSGVVNHDIQIYRQGMQHFVQALEFYVGHQLLEVTWNELVQDLENQVASLDDLYQVHSRYVQRAKSRLLMTPNASSVMKIVKEALNLVMNFGRSVSHLEGSCSESLMAKLKGTYEKFQHCAKLLYMVLEKIESKSHQAHLSNLLLVLNYNDFYV